MAITIMEMVTMGIMDINQTKNIHQTMEIIITMDLLEEIKI